MDSDSQHFVAQVSDTVLRRVFAVGAVTMFDLRYELREKRIVLLAQECSHALAPWPRRIQRFPAPRDAGSGE